MTAIGCSSMEGPGRARRLLPLGGTGPYVVGFSSAEAGERTAAARPVPPSVELTEGPHQKTPTKGTVRKHSYLCWRRHRVGRAWEGEKVSTEGPKTHKNTKNTRCNKRCPAGGLGGGSPPTRGGLWGREHPSERNTILNTGQRPETLIGPQSGLDRASIGPQ